MSIYILKVWEVKHEEAGWLAFQREATARLFAQGMNRRVRANYVECAVIDGAVVVPNTVEKR